MALLQLVSTACIVLACASTTLLCAGLAESAPLGIPCSGAVECEQLAELQDRAETLEASGEFAAAAATHERIASMRPNAHTAWRAARAWARLADVSADHSEERVRLAERGVEWAERGLELDSDCSECCLYRFVGLGHVVAARGGLAAAGKARELVRTLARCLDHEPSFVHAGGEDERANLYYAAAVLYRLLPESRMAQMVIGARGDKQRALDWIRRAHARSPDRVDYTLELATALLCLGREERDPGLEAEGLATLASVPIRRGVDPSTERLWSFAEQLRSSPEGACGLSRESVLASNPS